MSFKHGVFSVLFCLLIAVTCGCSKHSKTLDPNTLVLRLGGEPTVFNPILSTDTSSQAIEGLVFNGLVRINEDLKIEPDLAEKYEISPDGKTYTFYLRKNALWQDGRPVTAEDVVFTYQLIMDPKTNTVRRSNYVIDGVPVKVTALDAHTVRFVLKAPFAPFLLRTGLGIVPKHLLEKEDINKAAFNRMPIGSGPYKVTEWKSGQHVILEAFSDSFTPPKTKKIIYKIIPDNNTALVALKNEDVLMSNISQREADTFKSSVVDTYKYYDLMYIYLGFNLKNKHFKDLKVRQAIAKAIQKQALVDTVLKGHGKPAFVPMSPLLWAYPETLKEDPNAFDVEGAKALLKEAGYVLNPETKVLEKNGEPFTFNLITNKGNKEREKTAEIVARSLELLGIKVSIQVMEWSSFLKLVTAPTDPKPYDAVILGWSLSLEPDSTSTWHSSEYPKGFNIVGYANPEVDRMLEAGCRETDQAKRKAIYEQLFIKIAKDCPYVFLYYPESIVGANTALKGLSKPGPAGLLNNIETVTIEP